jgi:Flagellar motor switch/type III secretory pathway protein
MSVFSTLKEYDRTQRDFEHVLQYWETGQYKPHWGRPCTDGVIQLFTSVDGMYVLLDLKNWLSEFLPEEACVANKVWSASEVREMFRYSDYEVVLSLPDGETRLLKAFWEWNEDTDREMPMVDTSIGEGWIVRFSDDYGRKAKEALPHIGNAEIPFVLDLVQGRSYLTAGQINKLQEGDIVLIGYETGLIEVGGITIANFTMGDGIVTIDNVDISDVEAFEQLTEGDDKHVSISNIPLTISFVLQQEKLTLQELCNIQQGHVFTLNDGVLENVLIKANGTLVATGEVISINGKTGVEIHALYRN